MKQYSAGTAHTCDCGTSFSFTTLTCTIYGCPSCGKIHKRNDEQEVLSRAYGPLEVGKGRALESLLKIDGRLFKVIGKALVQTEDFKYWWYTLTEASTDELAVYLSYPFGDYFFHWSLIQRDYVYKDQPEVDLVMTAEGHHFHIQAAYKVVSTVYEGEVIWPTMIQNGQWNLLGGKPAFAGLVIQTQREKAVSLVDKVPQEHVWLSDRVQEEIKETCPNCKEPIALCGGPLTMRVCCVACFHTYDTSSGHLKLLGAWEKSFRPILRIGGAVNLKGKLYRVLGMVVREIVIHDVNWKEYQLQSEDGHGLCLVEMNGHWTLSTSDAQLPYMEINSNLPRYFDFEENTYKLFSRDFVDIAFTAGESLYKWSDTNLYVDYIAPPIGFTFENHGSYRINYRNAYIEVNEVKQRAELARAIPPTYGVGPLSPSLLPVEKTQFYRVLALLLFLFIGQSFLHYFLSRNALVHSAAVPVESSGAPAVNSAGEWGGNSGYTISPTFTIQESTTNLKVFVTAPVANNWASFETVLVNEVTGQQDVYYSDVEYYYGFTSGENWKEGSQKSNFYISGLNAGRYHLEVKCTQASKSCEYGTYAVYEDVVVTSNFMLSLAFLGLTVGLLVLIHTAREKKRFSNSEYNPYE